jgi:poly(3-hydroxybutyrate) depolymerase
MRMRFKVVICTLCAALAGALAGCSSSTPGGMVELPSAGAQNSAAGNGVISGAGTSTTGGGVTGSGGSSSTSGGTATVAGGASTTGGTSSGGSSGGVSTTGGTSSGGSAPAGMSAGCGKPVSADIAKSNWVIMADVSSKNTPPAIVVDGMRRGFAVVVPTNYNPMMPSRVIYEGAGCGDTGAANGATSSYHFWEYDKTDPVQTIQVGLDYGTVRKDHCYDNESPTSNDFKYFPVLHKQIEDTFCVDTTKEFFSGFSTGAWLANQLTCAFPDVLRGVVLATGNEPPMQPTCVPGHPVAGLFLHDQADPYNTYAGILPGCKRLLMQNGCTTTECAPDNASTTMPYPLASQPPPPQNTACIQFKGCPANAPVVFCQTHLNGEAAHYIGQDSWVGPLFWAFIKQF